MLGRFTKDEEMDIDEVLNRAADAVECLVKEGISSSMNKYNG